MLDAVSAAALSMFALQMTLSSHVACICMSLYCGSLQATF